MQNGAAYLNNTLVEFVREGNKAEDHWRNHKNKQKQDDDWK